MLNKKAFLLMEVMVSVLIITGGLLFVIRVFSTAKDVLSRSSGLLKYSTLLEEKMFDYEERGMIEDTKDSGHFPDRKDYLWETQAETLEFQSPELNDLCSVKLDVYRDTNKGAQKYAIWTYLDKKRLQE